jgi:hypothetical protein
LLPPSSSSSLDEREDEDDEETSPRLLCEDGFVIFLRYITVSYLGVFFIEVGG